ncbi:MAG: hypothetical protein A2X36_13740 [Elusimicrobia bacterium GWA2_69_24]|nr:MAG: hypothetical protein A2X36_13740 [Elusimicrobia bacterium GWA2_69_24]HBL18155.1 mucin desulfatase [Elusimicrobiota bacterium]
MAGRMTGALAGVAARFRLDGEVVRAEPHGRGHINDTYRIVCGRGRKRMRYILQHINRQVFPDPVGQIRNIDKVLAHLRRKQEDPRRLLTLVPTLDGKAYWRDPQGEFWRVYLYIEKARSRDSVRGPRQAYEAAKLFGAFQSSLADLSGALAETIPGFHDTPKRYRDFARAARRDAAGRAREAAREIDFAGRNKEAAGILSRLAERDEVPTRIVHNDTKINNVLFDENTGEGLCVLDLDTVMPGLSLYDFGDMVRAGVNPAAEDEPDVSKVAVRLPVFEGFARGYLEGAAGMLNEVERAHLAASAKVISFELGLRFLTDFLNGDRYFKTSRPGQNLDRCRTQFRLMELLSRSEGELQAIVASAARPPFSSSRRKPGPSSSSRRRPGPRTCR